MIAMHPEHYDPFLARCDLTSREYSILKNSPVFREQNGDEKRVIELLCEQDEALTLLYAATRHCPEAVPVIKNALHPTREL